MLAAMATHDHVELQVLCVCVLPLDFPKNVEPSMRIDIIMH